MLSGGSQCGADVLVLRLLSDHGHEGLFLQLQNGHAEQHRGVRVPAHVFNQKVRMGNCIVTVPLLYVVFPWDPILSQNKNPIL